MHRIQILALALLLFPLLTWGHQHPAYSHESSLDYVNPDWMSRLADNIPIGHISIPGTHDTMAYQLEQNDILKDIVITQTLNLEKQLESGIRAFDIRCRHFHNGFPIHHGVYYLKTNFDDVLSIMTRFLQDHPREVLLVRVMEEWKPEGNTRSFLDTFLFYKSKFSRIWEDVKSHPFLGEVRGKIVILQNFPGNNQGLDYINSFNIQDEYNLQTNWDLYSKWEAVKNHLQKANLGSGGSYVNYLSGSGGAKPYFVASGHVNPETGAIRLSTGRTTAISKNIYPDFPRVNCFSAICIIAFEGTNILTYDYIKSAKPNYVGIIMADFPGYGLVDAVIGLNF